jgi:hypothetical protein
LLREVFVLPTETKLNPLLDTETKTEPKPRSTSVTKPAHVGDLVAVATTSSGSTSSSTHLLLYKTFLSECKLVHVATYSFPKPISTLHFVSRGSLVCTLEGGEFFMLDLVLDPASSKPTTKTPPIARRLGPFHAQAIRDLDQNPFNRAHCVSGGMLFLCLSLPVS